MDGSHDLVPLLFLVFLLRGFASSRLRGTFFV
jgi:hypothetical protein